MRKVWSGFSLLELLVVVALLGVVCFLSAPSVSAAKSASLTKQEAKRFASWLDTVAIRALHRSSDYSISGTDTELRATDPSQPKKPISKFLTRGKVAINLGRSSVMFYRSGVATPASIRISGRGDDCVVRLSLRGRSTVDCAK